MKGINTNKRVTAVIYAVMIMLVTTTVAIGVYDFNIKTGTITVGNKSEEVKTKKITVGEVLEEQKITLADNDYINIAKDKELAKEFNIKIRRAVPVVLNFKGKEINLKTAEVKVEDILKSLSITYDEDDKITPALDTKVIKDMKISLVEYEEKINMVEEEIDFETETNENNQLEKGKSLTVQEGAKGLKENTVKEVYENGKLIDTQVTESKLVKEAVTQIVQNGTKAEEIVVASRGITDAVPAAQPAPVKQEVVAPATPTPAVAPVTQAPAPVQPAPEKPAPQQAPAAQPVASSNKSLEGARSIVMKASAYDLSFESCGKRPGDKYYGITATGTQARPGVVAVDPSVIPLGSKLYIESMDGTGSYGYASAEDKGGAIKGNRIDLFYANRSDALSFGRRQVKVYILN